MGLSVNFEKFKCETKAVSVDLNATAGPSFVFFEKGGIRPENILNLINQKFAYTISDNKNKKSLIFSPDKQFLKNNPICTR